MGIYKYKIIHHIPKDAGRAWIYFADSYEIDNKDNTIRFYDPKDQLYITLPFSAVSIKERNLANIEPGAAQ